MRIADRGCGMLVVVFVGETRTAVKVLLVERCWASNSRNQKTALLGNQLDQVLANAMR